MNANNVVIKIVGLLSVVTIAETINNNITMVVVVVVVESNNKQIETTKTESKIVLMLILYDNYNPMINEIKDQ